MCMAIRKQRQMHAGQDFEVKLPVSAGHWTAKWRRVSKTIWRNPTLAVGVMNEKSVQVLHTVEENVGRPRQVQLKSV